MKIYRSALIIIFFFCQSCKKLVTIPAPINSITTSETFSTPAQATSAMAGIYANFFQGGALFGNSMTTIFGGLSSDELIDYYGNSDLEGFQFNTNTLLSGNSQLINTIWTPAYYTIYQANAIIDNLPLSGGVSDSVKSELIGEAKFMRAFCYFYLTNLFGDVPLDLTVNYNKTSLLPKASSDTVYAQIIKDLQDAQSSLELNYSFSLAAGERVIPNKFAATALLARVYLYRQQWNNAYNAASQVIQNTEYAIDSSVDDVFSYNSKEAIWQLKQNSTAPPMYNITWEGSYFVQEGNPYFVPNYYLSSTFLNSIEPGDIRQTEWLDSVVYQGETYYLPYKYKDGIAQRNPSGSIDQYYMVLRLAEQYLIRSEAEANGANGGNFAAVQDLNVIRHRARLPDYAGSYDTNDILTAIYHERQIEFFAEWGHRWLDLKRTGNAINTLSTIPMKSGINANALYYPIPISELQADPNLTQNPGYK